MNNKSMRTIAFVLGNVALAAVARGPELGVIAVVAVVAICAVAMTTHWQRSRGARRVAARVNR